MSDNRPTGLGAREKDQLIRKALAQRQSAPLPRDASPVAEAAGAGADPLCSFAAHPGYQQVRIIADGAARLGVAQPFFKLHDGTAGAHTSMQGRDVLNFASYNYLGLSGHEKVNAAAKAAIDRYGTSVSASRVVSGERPIHRELEREIARLYGTDDAIAFVSGHATNVSTIGHLFGPRDLVLHDELIHNSVLQGIQVSRARRLAFAHNDAAALDALLARHRRDFERVLVVIEGIYSMDGDHPDLPHFVEVKRRHRAFLMVDEAHSFGVMGARGLGIREHFDLPANAVDIWMGTLSKSLAGCGGFVAGELALVEHLKFLAPGFLYSVGMSPPLAAASLAALQCMQAEPERVQALQQRSLYFRDQARDAGLDTGSSVGMAVIPTIIGSSIRTARLSAAMLERGINVQPILHPAVPEKSARLRFFVCCQHTEAEIDHTVQTLAGLLNAAD